MANTTNVLVDTNILLEDPDVLERIHQRGGFPFLTNTVLDELDYNKDINKFKHKLKSDTEILQATENAKNVRKIFREFTNQEPSHPTKLPTGESLLTDDTLTSFGFKSGTVYLIGRDNHRTTSNNDAKIIEVAKDYKMVLITCDKGLKVRAEACGVNAVLWTGPDDTSKKQKNPVVKPNGKKPEDKFSKTRKECNDPQPFRLYSSPIQEQDTALTVEKMPEAGDIVKMSDGHEFVLGKQISAGGEGTIYETPLGDQVCKIYHANRLTTLKKQKIELMVTRRISRQGICWPTQIVTDKGGEFVGYLMPRASGTTMQKAMFVKPVLEKTFPNWSRLDLVNVALTFVEHIIYLHRLNIIVGDINPMNFLVTEDSKELWMVDTDSFQVEKFPCPVGTINFTPPEIQGRNYSEFMRTKEHELFAVATMIFMILLPGKPPYSQQGGGTPSENIKLKNFPYNFFRRSDKNEVPLPKIVPKGTWQYIWGNLPYKLKEAFYKTFKEDNRVSVPTWKNVLRSYSKYLSDTDNIKQNPQVNEIFPLEFRIKDPIVVDCSICGTSVTKSKAWVEKLQSEGKPIWCPECVHHSNLVRLAKISHRAAAQTSGNHGAGGRGTASKAQYRQSVQRVSPQQKKPTTQFTSKPYRSNSAKVNNAGILGAIFRFLFK